MGPETGSCNTLRDVVSDPKQTVSDALRDHTTIWLYYSTSAMVNKRSRDQNWPLSFLADKKGSCSSNLI